MKPNYTKFKEEDHVQIRALLVPKSIHEKIKQDAADQMRTITAQAVAILISHYQKEGITKR